jgi:hypothetical protein
LERHLSDWTNRLVNGSATLKVRRTFEWPHYHRKKSVLRENYATFFLVVFLFVFVLLLAFVVGVFFFEIAPSYVSMLDALGRYFDLVSEGLSER